jgi:hypothetical protein
MKLSAPIENPNAAHTPIAALSASMTAAPPDVPASATCAG